MANKTYDDKEKNVQQWVDKINSFWVGDGSNIRNKTSFWDAVFHKMSDDDFWDFVDVADILRQQYSEDFYKWPDFQSEIQEIRKQLMLGKKVIRPMQTNANTRAFRSWMRVKDVLNKHNGWTPPSTNKTDLDDDSGKTPFERLFDFK